MPASDMNRVPLIPNNAPFTPAQRQWINGYLAGLFGAFDSMEPGASGAAGASTPKKTVLILYGSQTGTAESLAKKVAKEAGIRGFLPKAVCMEQYAALDIAKAAATLLITSTYGDGEPPDNAREFWAFLSSEAAPNLADVRYSILALGDTNYPAFCEFGKQCDARFEALGGKRIHPRVDCDVDYDEPARAWTKGVFDVLADMPQPNGGAGGLGAPALADTVAEPDAAAAGFSRQRPFPARLLANRLLNAPASAKEVRHFEICLKDSGLDYEAGDAMGVVPSNCPELVSDLLTCLGCDGEEAVPTPDGGETSLRHALAQHYDITKPSSDLLRTAAERSGDDEFRSLVLEAANREALKKWLWGREVVDVLARMTLPFGAADFVAQLKKLQPRLYSISSSPHAHPGEVHLTVAAVRYEGHDRLRKGVCSTFLADRAEYSKVPVFIQTSHGFRLPASGDVPIIMVGPGTGIAPFRAFLEERRATGASGGNWLFFGDQHRASDYLYREELEAMATDGHLGRLDLAFSRDQSEKIYVQHRMLGAAAGLWDWLQRGAHFYVCGDASRMAKDVDAALHTIAETSGGLNKESAAAFVAELKRTKRYQRDVY